MSFLHPVFLWGLAGASIPILIHLLGRRRPRPTPFPSLWLIRRTQRQRRSFSRLRNLLILALRVLAILAIATALAGPVSEHPALQAIAPGRTTALILVDTSASMQYKDAGGAVFERARQDALQILGRLPEGCRPVVGSAAEGVSLLTQASTTRAQAESDLQALKPGLARSTLTADLTQAAETLARLDAEHGRIFVVTDNQATAWTGAVTPPVTGSRPPVWVVDVSSPDPRNVAITEAQAADEAPIPGRPRRYAATFREWGAPPDALTVTIAPTGKPAFARTLPSFQDETLLSFEADAPDGGMVAIPADSLTADDRRYFGGGRARLRIVGRCAGDTRYLAAALASIGGVHFGADSSAAGLSAALAAADLAVLANVPGLSADDLAAYKAYVAGGGGLVVFLGDAFGRGGGDVGLLGALFGDGQVTLGGAVSPGGTTFGLGEVDTRRPPLQAFESARAGDLHEVAFRKALRLTTGSAVEVLARFEDDNPAIVEGTLGQGRVLLLNTTADTSWSNAPEKPVWLPLLHRIAFHCARRPEQVIPDGFCGETVQVRAPADSGGPLTITGPDGAPQTLAAQGEQVSYTLGRPGRYQVSWEPPGGRKSATFVVNVDPAESDLTVDPKRTLEACKGLDVTIVAHQDLAARLEATTLTRADLALPLLVLAALCLLAEGLLSTRTGLARDLAPPV